MKYCKKFETLVEKDEHINDWEGGKPRPTVCLVEEDNKCYFAGKKFKMEKPVAEYSGSDQSRYVSMNGVALNNYDWPMYFEQDKDELGSHTFSFIVSYYSINGAVCHMGDKIIYGKKIQGPGSEQITITLPAITNDIEIVIELFQK